MKVQVAPSFLLLNIPKILEEMKYLGSVGIAKIQHCFSGVLDSFSNCFRKSQGFLSNFFLKTVIHDEHI